MGIVNAGKYGAIGGLVDMYAGSVSGVGGLALPAVYGLFTPDHKDLDEVVSPRAAGNYGILESVLANTSGRPGDPQATTEGMQGSLVKKAGLAYLGMMLLGGTGHNLLDRVPVLRNFLNPLRLLGFYSGKLPYNAGGLKPLLWKSGLIPPGMWGWMRGIGD